MRLFRRRTPDFVVVEIAGQRLTLPKNASARMERDVAKLNPLASSLCDYWHTNRGDGGVPDRSSFDPMRLKPWLGFLSVYEFDNRRGDFRNRLEGSFVVDLTGENWTGRYASEVDDRFDSNFLAELREVLGAGRPSVDLIQIYQNDFGVAVRVLLPVASRPGAVANQVFVAIFANMLNLKRDS